MRGQAMQSPFHAAWPSAHLFERASLGHVA
jgi:hypothetical protein